MDERKKVRARQLIADHREFERLDKSARSGCDGGRHLVWLCCPRHIGMGLMLQDLRLRAGQLLPRSFLDIGSDGNLPELLSSPWFAALTEEHELPTYQPE